MDYDEIAAVYLVPLTEPIPVPQVPLTPARCLRDALEPIATQGWWGRSVSQRMQALGLDFFQGYVWGRAAALGQPSAAVVAATFGVFEPDFIGAVYESALPIASRHDVLVAREQGAVDAMAAITDPAVGEVADRLLDALVNLDVTARPLFAGLRSLPLPSDPGGRLWRAAELVREHRGDGHLAACIVEGLDPLEMNVLTEVWLGYAVGAYSGSRGYSPEVIAAAVASMNEIGLLEGAQLTVEGTRVRERIEASTDSSQGGLVAALGDDLDELVTKCARWSDHLVTVGLFPSDPRKRAAG